jgi:hypothetical protein
MSNRIILVFLALIFVIVVILTRTRIVAGIQSRLGGIISGKPKTSAAQILTPTPTQSSNRFVLYDSITPTPTVFYGKGSSPAGQTPATGPADFLWITIAGSLTLGLILRYASRS